MQSLRKWIFKPKKTDQSKLARFYFADEELNSIASELDSFDGRKEPERCATLVAQLRAYQDVLLGIIDEIMLDCVPKRLQSRRQYRAKFPDDVLQESLAGQLWFGAECLAAGSSIMNREVESASMRPMAKCLTKHLDFLRSLLREQCLRDPNNYSDKINGALIEFDRLFSDFELSYVSAMVPIKTMKEFDHQQDITVLFCETVQRALKIGLLTHESIDSFDPELMFTIPRLAIIAGLLIFPDGPLNPDRDPLNISEMFRQFQTLLYKIRELLYTLDNLELDQLEKMLSSLLTDVKPFTLIPPEKSSKFTLSTNVWTLPITDPILSGPAALADFIEPPKLPNFTQKKFLRRSVSVDKMADMLKPFTTNPETMKLQCNSYPLLLKSDSFCNGISSYHEHIELASDGEVNVVAASENDEDESIPNDDIIAQTVARAIKSFKPKMQHKFNFKLPKDTGNVDVDSNKNDENLEADSAQDGSDTISASESRQVIYLLLSDSEGTEDDNLQNLETSSISPIEPSSHQISFFTEKFYDTFEPYCHSAINDEQVNDDLNDEHESEPNYEKIFYNNKIRHNSLDNINISNNDITKPTNIEAYNHNPKVSKSTEDISMRIKETLNIEKSINVFDNYKGKMFKSITNTTLPEYECMEILMGRHSNNKKLNYDGKCKQFIVSRKSVSEFYLNSKNSKVPHYNIDSDSHDFSDHENIYQTSLNCSKNVHVQEYGNYKDNHDENREHVLSRNMERMHCITKKDNMNNKMNDDMNQQTSRKDPKFVKTSNDDERKYLSLKRNEKNVNKDKDLNIQDARVCKSREIRKKEGRRKSKLLIDKKAQLKISIGLPGVKSKFSHDSDSQKESATSSNKIENMQNSQSDVSMAIEAASVEARREVRLKFKDSSDLIHRLFVCISGVADQLQTNFASDFRRILKTVFDICQSTIFDADEVPVSDNLGTSPPHVDLIPDLEEPTIDPLILPEVVERETQYQASDVFDASIPELPPKWMDDNLSNRCMACEATFTFVRRRHHCRNCGKIFCGYCSSNSVPLPHYSINKPVRVCNRCFMFHVMPFTCVSST